MTFQEPSSQDSGGGARARADAEVGSVEGVRRRIWGIDGDMLGGPRAWAVSAGCVDCSGDLRRTEVTRVVGCVDDYVSLAGFTHEWVSIETPEMLVLFARRVDLWSGGLV